MNHNFELFAYQIPILKSFEPLAKCSGVVREKSPVTANMETSVTCVINFWKFGHKISVLP